MTKSALACFDLDGTLLCGDSFLAYLVYLGWRRRMWSAFEWLAVAGVARKLRTISLLRAKQLMLKPLIGLDRREIEWIAESFCQQLDTQYLRQGALDALCRHRDAGHTIVLLTSAPAAYLGAIGRMFKANITIGTELVYDGGVFRGELGIHMYAEAKVAKLLELSGGGCITYAYSDHHSDIPLLRASDYPCVVAPTRQLRRHAAECGWPVLDEL